MNKITRRSLEFFILNCCLLVGFALAQASAITGATYQYGLAPDNESIGPHPYGAGLLTDGTPDDPDGGTAKWPKTMNIRESAITFDLQKDYPLKDIKLVSKCDNEWWGVRYVTVKYRSADGSDQAIESINWYGTSVPLQVPDRRFELTIPMDNKVARYVEITVRNLHSGQNMPLTEVQFYEGFDPIIKTGRYSYTTSPAEEGSGPHLFGQGILTDATPADPVGSRATWPSSMQIRFSTITFDFLRNQPLEKIKLISTMPNEWWGIKEVTVAYRSEGGDYITEPAIQWFGQKLPLDVPERSFELEIPLQNKSVRYVQITIRNLHSGQNMPLTEVQFFRAVPDSQLSDVTASAARALADGQSNIMLEVTVKDKDDNPLPGECVAINKLAGTLPFQEREATTDLNGVAVFALASTHSGTATLGASIDIVSNLVAVNQTVNIEFLQATSETNSKIEFSDEPFSADGESIRTVKVVVKDHAAQPINGRSVTLASSEGIQVIGSATLLTGPTAENPDAQSGEAVFEILAEASAMPLSETLTATIAPDFASGAETILTKSVQFTAKVAISHDEPERQLAVGLAEEDVPAGKIPADGISRWKLSINLGQGNRLVRLEEKISGDNSALLNPGDIEPLSARTDSSGLAIFYISTANKIDSVEVIASVLNDVATKTVRLGFQPEEIGLYVTNVSPAANDEAAETTAPVVIRFNKEIFPDAVAVITLRSEAGEISDAYDNGNAISSGNVLTWRLPRLKVNVLYTVIIEGVKDANGEPMKRFSWQFTSIDTTRPEVKVRNGVLAVEPKPWSIDIGSDTALSVEFSEDLKTDAAGKPLGLKVTIVDRNGVELSAEKSQFLSYDHDSFTAVYVLSELQQNATYNVTVSGAVDYANLQMLPVSWIFSTQTASSSARVIKLESEKTLKGDVKVDSAIKVYFNKQLRAEPAPKIIVTAQSGVTVVGSTAFIPGLNNVALQFTPQEIFTCDALYQVTFENVVDLDGNELVAESISFLTEVATSSQQLESGKTSYLFELPKSDGGTVTLAIEVPTGEIPPGSFLEVGNVHNQEKQALAKRTYNPRLALTGAVYELAASGIAQGEKLARPLTIAIPYVAQDGLVETIGDKLVPAHSLRIFRWDSTRHEWLPVGGIVDEQTRTVSFEIDRFSIYGLLGSLADPAGTFLTEVALTTNPLSRLSSGARGQTMLKFYLLEPAIITLKVFEQNGRLVGTLVDKVEYLPGDNGIPWDGKINGRTLPRGLYIIQLYAVNNHRTAFHNQVLGIW
jgi:hypothetical protein